MPYVVARIVARVPGGPPVVELVGTGDPTSVLANFGVGSRAFRTDTTGSGIYHKRAGGVLHLPATSDGTGGTSEPVIAATTTTLGTVKLSGTPTDAANPTTYVKEQTDTLLAGKQAAFAAQAPGVVLAGPTSGANAAPTFRALAAADIPALGYEASGTAQALLNTHVAAADPHSGYQRESEKGSANGYAPLDATGKVPNANLPASSGTPVATTSAQGTVRLVGTPATASDPTVYEQAQADTAMNTAAAAAVQTHVETVDPHPTYQREIEKGGASGYASLDASALLPTTQLPTVPVAKGGTGLTAPGTSGNVLTSNGSAWVSSAPGAGGGGAPLTNKSTATQTIGTAAAALTGSLVALEAGKRYRFRALVNYRNGTTTAVHALRATYSGTLSTAVPGVNVSQSWGTNGVPTVYAAAGKSNTLQINATMPVTTAGFGNTGSTTADAQIEVTGTLHTSTAGNLELAMVSSAANGLVVHHVVMQVWETP